MLTLGLHHWIVSLTGPLSNRCGSASTTGMRTLILYIPSSRDELPQAKIHIPLIGHGKSEQERRRGRRGRRGVEDLALTTWKFGE